MTMTSFWYQEKKEEKEICSMEDYVNALIGVWNYIKIIKEIMFTAAKFLVLTNVRERKYIKTVEQMKRKTTV